MSSSHDTAHTADHDAAHDMPHEGPIRTPTQLFWAVLASFVVPILAIILLVNFVTFGAKDSPGSDLMGAEAVAQRLQRVGSVEVRDPATAVLRTGEQVFQAACAACHTSGAAGAPKVGDAAAWGPRIQTGYQMLLTSALKGKGAMGAQGGGDYSDVEVGRAVVHMTNQSGAKFDVPNPAAAAASAPN